MEDLCLSRTKKQIYDFIWWRLGKVARTGFVAADAALGRVVLDDGDGGNDSRNIQDVPLLADILGSNYVMRGDCFFVSSFHNFFPESSSPGNRGRPRKNRGRHVAQVEQQET